MPHVNKKPLARKFGSHKKLGLQWTMDGLGKQFRKESNPKIQRTVKIKVKLPHVNKKPLARKRIVVQTPFSHSSLKMERKKFHAPKPLAFSLHFRFRRDQNHYSNLTSKIMKMCEEILKKRQRPNTIQILWTVKKNRTAIIAGWEAEAAVKNRGKCSKPKRKESKFKSWTNLLLLKKPVEYQYSSPSRKNL